MTNLLFLSNTLIDPSVRADLRVPLVLVAYGFVHGKMYKHFRSEDAFVVQDGTREWGGHIVYGALYSLRDYTFYIRMLDSYHACSLSHLARNHALDTHHRLKTLFTPIRFESAQDLGRLKYWEREPVEVDCYFGNMAHHSITRRVHASNSYRITEGILKESFLAQYKEEQP